MGSYVYGEKGCQRIMTTFPTTDDEGEDGVDYVNFQNASFTCAQKDGRPIVTELCEAGLLKVITIGDFGTAPAGEYEWETECLRYVLSVNLGATFVKDGCVVDKSVI